jgi:hypothetical protein
MSNTLFAMVTLSTSSIAGETASNACSGPGSTMRNYYIWIEVAEDMAKAPDERMALMC